MEKSDLTIEQIVPFYFNANAIRQPKSKLFRVYTPKGRYYYTYDFQTEEIQLYIGVTTMIGTLVPKGDQLIKWMVDVGPEQSKIIAGTKAAYGTLMHSIMGKYTLDKKFDLADIPFLVDEAIAKLKPLEQMHVSAAQWVEDLTSDLLAWAQFVKDYNFEPIAMEVMLTHPDGYAGTMDFLGYMDIKQKIDPTKKAVESNLITRRVLATIDAKSGRKGFYQEHEIQLESYRHLIHAEWPDLHVEKIYNWSPKDWRTAPDYNLKDQSNSVEAAKFNLIVEMAKIELLKKPISMLLPKGVLGFGEGFEATDYINRVDLIDYLKDYHRRKNYVKATGFEVPANQLPFDVE